MPLYNSQSAANISSDPVGNISASKLQTALAELDTEKEATGTALALLLKHLAANDPHQTKCIDSDYTPETNSVITGKNAQSAISQLAALIADLQTQIRNLTPSSKPPLIVDPFADAEKQNLKNHYPITHQGTTWIEPVGSFKIYGNKAKGEGVSQTRAYIESTASTGIVINAVLILRQVTQPQGVIVRLNAANGYHIRIVYTLNKFELLEVGSSAVSKTSLLESIAFDQAYRFRIFLEGSKITLLVNGVQKLSWATSFNQDQTRHGIYCSSSTTTEFEDFEVIPL